MYLYSPQELIKKAFARKQLLPTFPNKEERSPTNVFIAPLRATKESIREKAALTGRL
jgi:hypothetical protein